MKLFITFVFAIILASCKQEVNPCNCSKNLLKIEKEYDADLDDRCDSYVESLNEKEARKWNDSMMNCVSNTK